MFSETNAAALRLREEGDLNMSIATFEAQLTALGKEGEALHAYMLVDPAQDSRLPGAIVKAVPGLRSKCLLSLQQGADLERVAPHLVSMPAFDADKAFWQAIFDNGEARPACQTVIASALGFDALYAHLHSQVEVVMPDGEIMVLAFWDPAILGTLLGQPDDTTLHIPGPALTLGQQAHLMKGMLGWWYWDRDGGMHSVRVSEKPIDESTGPLKLVDVQVDILVEASVPDHLLSYLRQTKPQLLGGMPASKHYQIIKKYLKEARMLELFGMQDIMNYICAVLIYGERMALDPKIAELLTKVKAREISINDAFDRFP